MKKSLTVVIALLLLCTVFFSGCSAPEDNALQLDPQKLNCGVYTYATRIVNGDVAIEYNTVYTVTKYNDNGTDMIRIESNGEREGETIHSVNDLLGAQKGELTPFSPIKVSMEYKNQANSQNDVIVDVAHTHDKGSLTIKLQQYPSGANEMETREITVATGKQYYDSESLPFIIGCLKLEKDMTLNFTLSSSNRDALQSMNLAVADVSEMDINGQKVECYCVTVRPNTMFSHFATLMYYRTSDQRLMMIKQETVTFTLTDFQPEQA
ncbi:MAG: hypothetical protein IKK58_03635 [Clostridia bacterium]|nr:hypothetical protein [Clostridia bacterium]